MERAADLQPDRYYLLGDAGSFFFEPAGDNEGFESPEAAAEWARTQTIWPELDLSDGYAVAIVLGSEFNANQAAWEAWEGGEFPDAPRVHNYGASKGAPLAQRAMPAIRTSGRGAAERSYESAGWNASRI